MAQDLGLDHSASVTAFANLFGSAISAGGSATSDAVDLGSVSGGMLGLELKLVAGSGTVDGPFVVRLLWSLDNTDFTDGARGEVVWAYTPTASATAIMIRSVPIRARYVKMRVENQGSSGPQITTSSACSYQQIYGNQA